ncbi:MAG: outer membrane lipoprotein carrier protein LolA [Sneathiella sp.]|nr:outer membrane lipoprotein carrier protein LolA [Sneathiella sp.]
MKKLLAKSLTLGCLLIGLMAPTVSAATLSEEDKADIKRVEDYLNNISTMKANFLQVNAEGQFAEGTVYLNRPGRARFEYEPPAQILVIADGLWLVFHDKELNETNRIPLSSTPISVLLEENATLSGDVTVTSVEKDGGVLRVNIIDTSEPDEGGITLVFSIRPFELRKWLITDAQGLTTSVTLSEEEFGIKLKPELFLFKDEYYDRN